ncbi:hypothetical protein M8C21_023962 [Ambrosia artemisiifolia]|uniref:Uncharacterized protein n=1 Tax=Ambrosia artemisiifolia TaxID=4212 RepID=A0AAD5GIP6_AMBAR|nr:hypothetical protein M8C21_023962 [Ambrosia artemisiifolia]
MLGMSAMQLLEISKQLLSGEDKKHPAEFDVFEEKKFAFKIRVGQFNIDKHLDGYGIRKLTNDSSIVASLEERFPHIQDSVGDNTTQESSARVSFISDVQEVKCSLDKVYELDDDAAASTTKILKSDEKCYSNKSSETPFLIPKQEK